MSPIKLQLPDGLAAVTTAAPSSAISALAARASTIEAEYEQSREVEYDAACSIDNLVTEAQISALEQKMSKEELEKDDTFLCYCQQQAELDRKVMFPAKSGEYETTVGKRCQTVFRKWA